VISELYRLATLPVAWLLGAGYLALTLLDRPAPAAYAVAGLAAVVGGRGILATSLCAVPMRSRLFAAKAGAVLTLSGPLTGSVRGVLLSLFGLGLALLTRGLVGPVAVLGGVPILLTPVLRAVVPRVVPYLPDGGSLAVLAVWAGGALAGGWIGLARRDV
jgi:hypothetical protein